MLDDVVSLLLPHLCGDDVVVHPLLSFIALRAVAIVLQPTTRSVSHQRGSSSIVNHIFLPCTRSTKFLQVHVKFVFVQLLLGSIVFVSFVLFGRRHGW